MKGFMGIVYLPGLSGFSGVVTFLGVEYYPKDGSGLFKEISLNCNVELKYGIGNFQLDDTLDFTPSYLQSIKNQFHTDSNCFPEVLRV